MRGQSRRRFVQGAGIAGLAVAAGCARLPWQAPPPPKAPRIGYLSGTSPTTATDALLQELAALGYAEGQNIAIAFRSAEEQANQLAALAADLVNLPVAVLVVSGALPIQAAKSATSTIPIVIAYAGDDPVAAGYVASLARPGGNVTGLSAMSPQLSGKRLELLKDSVGGGARIAVLWHAVNPITKARFDETQLAAQVLGVQIFSLEVRGVGDLDGAFQTATRERAAGLITLQNLFTSDNRAQIVELAAKNRLPAMYKNSDWTNDGGLMAYGANRATMHRRAPYYVDRILRGTKPADLPVEQPMVFDFAINVMAVQALGC